MTKIKTIHAISHTKGRLLSGFFNQLADKKCQLSSKVSGLRQL